MNQFFQKVFTTTVCILCFVAMQISLASVNEAYAENSAIEFSGLNQIELEESQSC